MATFVRGSPVSTLGPVMIGHRLVCPVLMAEIDHSGVERAKHLGRVQDSVRASLRLPWYLEVVTQCCPFCISQLSPTALPSLLPPPPPNTHLDTGSTDTGSTVTFSKHSPADVRFPIQGPHLHRSIFTDGALRAQAGCVLGEAKCKRAHVPCPGATPDHLGSGQSHLEQTVSDSHTASPGEGRM